MVVAKIAGKIIEDKNVLYWPVHKTPHFNVHTRSSANAAVAGKQLTKTVIE
jgi:hypothetical protein